MDVFLPPYSHHYAITIEKNKKIYSRMVRHRTTCALMEQLTRVQ